MSVPRLDVGPRPAPAPSTAPSGSGASRLRCGLARRLARSGPNRLSVIRVDGNSMAPTLADGDEILVDRGDGAARLRDGIYVLRVDDALVVKRLAVGPAARPLDAQRQSTYPAGPTRAGLDRRRRPGGMGRAADRLTDRKADCAPSGRTARPRRAAASPAPSAGEEADAGLATARRRRSSPARTERASRAAAGAREVGTWAPSRRSCQQPARRASGRAPAWFTLR